MLDELELQIEIEFNREKLGTFIPNRLEELLYRVDGARKDTEDWYTSLWVKIGNSLIRVCQDLFNTIDQKDVLPAAAWNARNLLELYVWAKYCALSRKNARRFHEDAIRDVLEITNAHAAMCKLAGVPNPNEDATRRKIADRALNELGLESIDTNYERVVDAAKHVGLGDAYKHWNKHLSKFAHPTAGLVIGMMHQTDLLRHVQSNCTTMGLYYAGQCVIVFEKVASAIRRKVP